MVCDTTHSGTQKPLGGDPINYSELAISWASSEIVAAPALGEQAVLSNPVEAPGGRTTDELVGSERHQLGLAVLAIVLPGEADLSLEQRDQLFATRWVSAEIGQHLIGAAERRLGKDGPFDALELVELGGEARAVADGL